ncbi:hypothetical protein T484DRAFT_1824305 [Baffinella frigidus]|nr:hypothetical protein T484DRAFT_1824305 [Cryptophyta sp. CCMP2293]
MLAAADDHVKRQELSDRFQKQTGENDKLREQLQGFITQNDKLREQLQGFVTQYETREKHFEHQLHAKDLEHKLAGLCVEDLEHKLAVRT